MKQSTNLSEEDFDLISRLQILRRLHGEAYARACPREEYTTSGQSVSLAAKSYDLGDVEN
jgi:hypothetical protein